MKPIYSETATDTMAACVASILEVGLSEIPDFFSTDATYKDPLYELQTFLEDVGWLLIEMPYLKENVLGIAIMSFGEADGQYAAVWQEGVIHDPRPSGSSVVWQEGVIPAPWPSRSSVGHPGAYFVLVPMDITDYVRTVHSQPPDHAYWSQVEPGADFLVWDDLEDQILHQKFCFYADGRPWFADKPGRFEVQAYNYATPARSVI